MNMISACRSGPSLRSMFEARKRVFVDLLRWDVPVVEGSYEVDQFDTPDATYLILVGDGARHRASVRILRTDQPHILQDLFPFLCDSPIPIHRDYREIKRFCIEPTLPRSERRIVRNQLITAIVDHALACGITSYTAVATRSWADQIAEFGWECSCLGQVHQVAGEALVGIKIEIDDRTRGGLIRGGVYRSGPFQTASFELEFAS